MPARHRYTAYGLAIASDLELPELIRDPAPPDTPALLLRLGPTPDRIEDPVEERILWATKPGSWLHDVPGVGRFFVHKDGREVVIERRGGSDVDLRAFLFGTTLGAILHHRGLFVLHASAVALPGGAVAIAGGSGAGKSTTLAELARRGHAVLSDDKTVVRFGDEGPEVVPGYPTLRLWRDAALRVGVATDELPPVRKGIEKFLYTAPRFETEPTRLRAIVVIIPQHQAIKSNLPGHFGDTGVAVVTLNPHISVSAVLHQTYRRQIVNGAGLQADHFRWAARLAGDVPVHRIRRASTMATVPAVADAVEAVLAESAVAVKLP